MLKLQILCAIKYSWVAILLLTTSTIFAQYNLPENNTWIFGSSVRLNFNSGSPVYSHTTIEMGGACTAPIIAVLYEASATVSDKNGQLLFCTDGSFVWDRAQNKMPNAQALHPYGATKNMTQYCTQGATIVPMPGDPNKYYVFSLTGSEVRNFYVNNSTLYCGAPNLDGGTLFYSIVDMSLNGGMGDVVPNQKWIQLDTGLTEKAIVVSGEHCDVWLLAHARDTNVFKAYQITKNGINPNPVLSYAGMSGYIANFSTNAYWTSGQMAISPDRRKLASAFFEGGVLETYDFDPNTGSISNPLLLYNGFVDRQCPYGVAFSPDNSKLYAYISNLMPNTNGLGTVYQYNLSLSSNASIVASKKALATSFASAQLKLASNGKIYFPLCKTNPGPTGAGTFVRRYLSAINFPNVAGAACQYIPAADSFISGSLSGLTCNGLPNEVARAQPGGDTIFHRVDTALCAPGDSLVFNATAGYNIYLWDDGNTSPRRTIKQRGKYWVIARDSCHTIIDSFIVKQMDTTPVNSDVYICLRESGVELHAPNGFDTYTWSDGSTDTTLFVSAEGVYSVNAVTSGYCTDRTDSFIVDRVDESFALGNDTIICDGSPLLLKVSVPGASYLWQDGRTDSVYNVTVSGLYNLAVNLKGCKEEHSINIQIQDAYQDLGSDTTLCSEDVIAITLQARMFPGDNVTWSDGSHAPSLLVKDTGTYWVTVTGICTTKDAIQISKEMCNCSFAMPTAFTPNGDGRNDIFRPVIEAECPITGFELHIFNRWGQLIYSGTDPLLGWDGTQNGTPCSMGTYMYTTRFIGGTSGKEQFLKGDVTLIR